MMQGSLFRKWLTPLVSLVIVFGIARTITVNATALAQTPDARARAIVAQMTLDEKILELHGVGGTSPNLRIVPAIPRLGIPAFVVTNGGAGVSYGTINPRTPATALPAPLADAASWDTSLANSYGTVIGKEAKILGNDLLEGPDMNLVRVPQGGRTFEMLREDPFLSGQIAASQIQGIQSQGVIAEAKHFVGNEQEVNRQSSNDVIDQRTLRELYLVPFEMSVKQGNVGAVMCAYPKVNGAYGCDNSFLMNTVLKGNWNFQGLVTFDVTNTGSRSGSEVAELYVGMPAAAGEPPKQLKGFQRLTLAAGATGHASIQLDARAFQHWNTSTNAWAITPGSYQIQVGSSSRTILLQGSLTE